MIQNLSAAERLRLLQLIKGTSSRYAQSVVARTYLSSPINVAKELPAVTAATLAAKPEYVASACSSADTGLLLGSVRGSTIVGRAAYAMGDIVLSAWIVACDSTAEGDIEMLLEAAEHVPDMEEAA